MKYYQFIPIWKSNKPRHRKMSGGFWFVGDNSICDTKFKSIADGLDAANGDGTLLREENWEIYECSFFGLLKTRIMLGTLERDGLLTSYYDEYSNLCANTSKVYVFPN